MKHDVTCGRTVSIPSWFDSVTVSRVDDPRCRETVLFGLVIMKRTGHDVHARSWNLSPALCAQTMAVSFLSVSGCMACVIHHRAYRGWTIVPNQTGEQTQNTVSSAPVAQSGNAAYSQPSSYKGQGEDSGSEGWRRVYPRHGRYSCPRNSNAGEPLPERERLARHGYMLSGHSLAEELLAGTYTCSDAATGNCLTPRRFGLRVDRPEVIR